MPQSTERRRTTWNLDKTTDEQLPDSSGIEFPVLNQREIAQLRARMKLTQADLARLLGVANSLTISHWETGVSMPKGAVMRFLCLLDALSDAELSKIIDRLKKLSQEESRLRS